MKNIVSPLVWLCALLPFFSTAGAWALDFPAAGWHRGDVGVAQESSRKALAASLQSPVPNIETDLIDFIDETGKRVGLLAHECDMERVTGSAGHFMEHHNVQSLPRNSADSALSPEPFITVIDLFEMIKAAKEKGVVPVVSLDLKEEGRTGREFGEWIGGLIRQYGFQDHVFASSFEKSNVDGVESACPECMTGGLVYNDHWALKHLDYHHTTLDLNTFSRMTFFLGFLGKNEVSHDFVLIQDDIVILHPELIGYWKNVRNVKFVGAFAHNKTREYTEKEWAVLKKCDWLELEPKQIRQYMKMNSKSE